MMAYLVMMTLRLIQLHGVLKSTGSFYLHCDPTASHYLKVILDSIFRPENFRNEISWKRSTGAVTASKKLRASEDKILFYTKSDDYTWNPQYELHDPEYIKKFYNREDKYGKFMIDNLTQASKPKSGSSGKDWRGISAGANKHWITIKRESLPIECRKLLPDNYEKMNTQERLDVLANANLIYFPKKENGKPRIKRYLSVNKGMPLNTSWDIPPISSHSKERLGFQTQKPIALLERILKLSSNEGDIVLDPFCGCGTTVHAAQKLNRTWIGIDITHIAISLIEYRMKEAFNEDVEISGIPKTIDAAWKLAADKPFQFEAWAVVRIKGIRPNQKQVGDKGMDGRGRIYIGEINGKIYHREIVVSVKGGKNLNPSMIRDLIGTINLIDKDGFGVFVCISKPTQNMMVAAAQAGVVKTPLGIEYPKIQIYTIQDYFKGKVPKLPTREDYLTVSEEGKYVDTTIATKLM